MTISQMRRGPHLSASSISEYTDCGLSYRFSRIEHIKAEFKSDALEFGTVIHRVLGEFYEAKMEGIKQPLEKLIETFELYWSDAAENDTEIKYKEGKNFNVLLKEGKELLSVYYKKLPDDNFKVIAIEEPVSFLVEGVPLPVIGVVDLIEEDESGVVTITDFKTSSKAYTNDDIDNNPQLTIYYMALRANGYANREILLKFDVLIKTKTPKFEQYYITRTEDDEKRMIKKIRHVYDGIDKGVFIPNDSNWKCKGCFYKKHCDDYFRR